MGGRDVELEESGTVLGKVGGASGLSRRALLAGLAGLGVALAGTALAGCSGAASSADAAGVPATSASASSGASAGGDAKLAVASTASSGADSAASSLRGTGAAVVYFSMPLTSAPDLDVESGASVLVRGDGSMVGLNQMVAEYVSQQTGADLIRIVAQDGWYPTDTPEDLIDFAQQEQDDDGRPPYTLQAPDGSEVGSLAGYDTLYIGYPIWWYELPMIMDTFFEGEDLSGKTIHMFVVHGGSGLSGTPADIERMQPGASVDENGLSINRAVVGSEGESDAHDWLAGMGTIDE
jgi:flavodoxin